MSAVRLVRGDAEIESAVRTLAGVREAVRGVMPAYADVRVCVTGSDEVQVEVLVHLYEDREAALFNIRSGIVPRHTFHSVSHGLEHGTRGRHRIFALLDT